MSCARCKWLLSNCYYQTKDQCMFCCRPNRFLLFDKRKKNKISPMFSSAKSVSSQSLPSSSPSTLSPPQTLSPLQTVADPKQIPPKTSSFYDCVWPTYFLSRAYGLLSFSIQTDSSGHMQRTYVTTIDAIVCITAVSFNCLLLYLLAITFIMGTEIDSTVLFMGSRVGVIYALTTVTIAIPADFFNRDRLLGMLKEFQAIDKEVKSSINWEFQFFWFTALQHLI